MHIQTIIIVALGGAIEAILRLVLSSNYLPQFCFTNFPLPIIIINVIGCFLMGVITETMASYWPASESAKIFLTTGILGGFTTFLAFSLEFGLLIEKISIS